jgi:hypothetical protein
MIEPRLGFDEVRSPTAEEIRRALPAAQIDVRLSVYIRLAAATGVEVARRKPRGHLPGWDTGSIPVADRREARL